MQVHLSHEVIGKDACEAILTYSRNRGSQIKAGGGASSGSGGKGGNKGKTNKSQSTNNNKTKDEEPKEKIVNCRNWYSVETPRVCKFGDSCRFIHGE